MAQFNADPEKVVYRVKRAKEAREKLWADYHTGMGPKPYENNSKLQRRIVSANAIKRNSISVECPHCGKTIGNAPSLALHIKKIHNDKIINHTVKQINFLGITEDVYDLSVEGTHNFAISAGVFVHNCHISQAHWTPIVMGIVEELKKVDPLFAMMGKPPCYENGKFNKCAYQGIAEERYGKFDEDGVYFSKDKGPICPLFHASLPKEAKLDLKLVPAFKIDKDLNAKFSKLWNFDNKKESENG